MASNSCKAKFKEWMYFKLKLSFENEETASDFKVDLITWKQLINNALKRTHGIFGEGIEYFFLNQDDKISYVKVNYLDKDTFSSAISTYISSDSLLGVQMVVTMLQQESDINNIKVSDDDKLWFSRVLENEIEEAQCY